MTRDGVQGAGVRKKSGRRGNGQGMALVAALMLIVFAALAVGGVTFFIVGRLSQHNAEERFLRCIYLADAGIQNAVYFYRFRDLTANGYFSLGQTNVDAANYFVLGASAADLLMVNTVSAALGGSGNRDLLNLSMQNAVNSSTITIDRLVVTWNNARQLTRVRINNSNVWSGTASSPANININNVTLNTTPSTVLINYLRFNGNMTGATVSVRFVMTDATSKTLTVYPASSQFNFTLKSMGKTAGSSIYRTAVAEYNAATGRIVDYEETNAQVP